LLVISIKVASIIITEEEGKCDKHQKQALFRPVWLQGYNKRVIPQSPAIPTKM